MDALIYPAVWLLGLMLAPHTLALLGNLAGQLQWLLPVVLAGGVGLYWINGISLNNLTQTSHAPLNAIDALSREIGDLPAAMLFFCGRIITTLALSTVLLVTSGFVFNETFVYWFPNFAFAFILLGLVMVIHLIGAMAARRFQLLCIALVLTGIAVLTVMGLVGGSQPVARGNFALEDLAMRSFLAVSMLLVGFDLVENHDKNTAYHRSKPVLVGLVAAGTVLTLWAVVSILNVPAHKLADSFIAHTLAAKAVGGQGGRMIMGVVIIAGSCAAVNALFWNLSRSLGLLTSRWQGIAPVKGWIQHGATGSLLSGIIVAGMMATGMAGSDDIDTYVRAGLYFWMVYYAGVHLAVLLRRRNEPRSVSASGFRMAFIGWASMSVISVTLITTDPEWALVLKAVAAILVVIAGLSILGGIGQQKLLMKGNAR